MDNEVDLTHMRGFRRKMPRVGLRKRLLKKKRMVKLVTAVHAEHWAFPCAWVVALEDGESYAVPIPLQLGVRVLR